MSTTLQSVVLERERILYPGKNLGASNSKNISEFMTDKMNDQTRAKNERLFRLETKIKELQDNVAKANDENNNYSNQMIKEYEIFQKARESELKQGLAAYADCHIDFYKKVSYNYTMLKDSY
jgi:sorting nexin-4